MSKRNMLRGIFTHFACSRVILCAIVAGVLELAALDSAAQTTYTVPLIPKYQVMTVVYAPPGSASSVTYANSVSVGSSNSFITNSNYTYTQSTSTTSGFSLSIGPWSFGSQTTNTSSDGWGMTNQSSTQTSVQTTQGNSVTTAGPVSSALGVNHDNDIIYVWLNPMIMTTTTATSGVIPLTWTGLNFNSCDVTDLGDPLNFYQVMNGCDPNQYPFPDIIGVPVWCLKNPYYPAPSCAQWLAFTSRSWDLNTWGTDTNGLPLGPGLTLQDYADILSADPFVTQTLVPGNTTANYYCHPTYGVNIDPNDLEILLATPATAPPSGMTWPTNYCGIPNNGSPTQVTMQRFDPFETVQYPEPGINGEPQTYSGTFTYNKTVGFGTSATYSNTHGNATSTTNSFGYTNSLPIPVPGLGTINLGLGFSIASTNGTSQAWTNAQTNATTQNIVNGNSASYSITGPQAGDNYTGPVVFDVYKDNVFGTFAFYSNLQRSQPPIQLVSSLAPSGSAPIGVSATVNFGTLRVGTTSTAQSVTLTNNSPYPMTMVAPAVTFSDPGFSIVPGSDYCSNQVLYPYSSTQGSYTCTMKIQFAPVVSDAPTAVSPSYPITANLIAAGTENIPFYYETTPYYQNILVTSTGQTVGATATPVTSMAACTVSNVPTIYPQCDKGATVVPTNQNVTGQPNGFQFAASNYTPQSQTFTFTNNYSSNVTFPLHSSNPPDIVLTDGNNFTVTNDTGTGGCSGATVPAFGGQCSFTVQYLPLVAPPASGIFNTGISAMAIIDWPTGVTPVEQLAGAGAVGPVQKLFTITPTSFSATLTNPTRGSFYPVAQLTLTNTYPYALQNLGDYSVFAGERLYLNGCPNGSGTCNCGSYGGPVTLAAGASCQAVAGYFPNADGTYKGNYIIGGVLQTTGSPLLKATTAATITVTGTHNYQTVSFTGAEQSRIVTKPAKPGKVSLTISGAVNAPFTGTRQIVLTVGGFEMNAYYDDSATSQTVALALAAAANGTGSPVTATVKSDIVTLKSIVNGVAGNLAYTTTGTADFAILPVKGSLTGGADEVTTTTYDGGLVNVAVGTVITSSRWGRRSTPQNIAAALATSLNSLANGAFTATATDGTITITTTQNNGGSPDVTASVTDTKGFDPASFAATTGN